MYLYSKTGAFHQANGCASQDVIKTADSGNWQLVAIADGVSTEEYGGIGAELACAEALNYCHAQHEKIGFLPKTWSEDLLAQVSFAIKRHALLHDRSFTEYACTLMVLVFEKDLNVLNCCNIGDGLVLGIEKSKTCNLLMKPQDDTFGCPTIVTTGIESMICTQQFSADSFDHILLCTDGAWKSIYTHGIMKPHVKNALIHNDISSFIGLIREANGIADCTLAIIDTGRVV